jgi:hypothetical protein
MTKTMPIFAVVRIAIPDIEPEWTLEAAGDLHRVVRDPDPRSRAAYIQIIGYSPGAGSP